MLRLHTILAVPMLMMLHANTVQAVTILSATLTNSQENPPVTPTLSDGTPRPASSGNASFVLNDAQTALTFTATIFNIDFTGTQTADLNDNLTVAHIHAGPTVTPATNGPIVWGFFGSPFNDTTPNDIVLTPFTNAVGGVISGKWDAPEGNNTNLAAQVDNILTGRAYINFHSVQFGGGEVRGQIVAVPEPATLALLGTGIVGLFGLRRRSYPRG